MDGTLMQQLNIVFVEASASKVVATMPVEGNMQPFGVLHGGATAALCESAASLGAALAAGPNRVAMGLEINVNHLRSVSAGSVVATAIPPHFGSPAAVWEIRVHDDRE